MSTSAEAAERLLARTMSPTGTNLPMDIETVARAVLDGEREVERLQAALATAAGRLGHLSTVLSLSTKPLHAKDALKWSEEARAALDG
jgi:hypothetical protein